MATSTVTTVDNRGKPGARFFRPELDILRFFAFLLVFAAHVSPDKLSRWLSAGALGVPLFFLLSAYLITELLFLEKDAHGTVNLRAFYMRRILRIWPLYFLVLFLGVLLSHILGASRPVGIAETFSYLFLSGNWYTAFHNYLPLGFGALWSLCVEEQFYLLWPSVVKHLSRRSVLLVCTGIWIASQAATIIAWANGASRVYMWTSTPGLMQYFAIGGALSVLLHGRVPNFRRGRVGVIFVGVLLFLLFHNLVDWWIYLLAGLGATLIFLGFLGMTPGRIAGKFRYPGKISYGLYVYHLPIILLSGVVAVRVFHIPVHHGVTLVKLGLGLPLTLLIAHLSYRYFETPFLKLKERFEVVRSRPV